MPPRLHVSACEKRSEQAFIDFLDHVALQLMENEVVAAIGPQPSGIAHVISQVVNELHVPLLSFGATDPSL